MFHIRRLRVRIVHILPYLAFGAAVALLAAAVAVDGPPLADMFNALAVLAGSAGVVILAQRPMLRLSERNHKEIMETLQDKIVLIAAAGAADAIHAHLGPDSLWRQNLIREIADLLNDDTQITLAAVEGSIHELFERLKALERANRHQGK